MSRRFRMQTLLVAFLTAAVLSLSACGSASPIAQQSKSTQNGGVATMALPPGLYPNQIFPLASIADVSNASYVSIQDFYYLMWRPLYWFGNNGSPGINYKLSLANPPKYSNGGRTVTITMKHTVWSDGHPLTSRDVEFYMDMFAAERTDYFNYVPGYIPDNLVSSSYPSSKPYQFSLTFNKAYSPTWLLYNQLSEIMAFPQHAWDKTSSASAIGNQDKTKSGAQAVWKYLNAQSVDVASYASNPLWKTVDGPWVLSTYLASTGYSAFTPNDRYFAGKPHLSKFVEEPFTSDTAEYDAVLAGTVDYGYVPPEDAKSASATLKARGYSLHSWVQWGIDWFPLDYANPTVGPIFKQLYFRQALQHVVNQPQYVTKLLDGYAYPTYGPVPLRPQSPDVSSYERSNPYPYSLAQARSLLTAHGWQLNPGKVMQCVDPGTGPSQCGANIAKSETLAFTMLYASGSSALALEMSTLQSSAAQVGIRITLDSSTGGGVIGTIFGCNPSKPSTCSWEMGDASVNGFAWTYSPDYYPTGESLFAPGSVANEGHYNDSKATALIHTTNVTPGTGVLHTYENYLAKQLPVIWLPTGYYQISAIKDQLKGTLPQDPNVQIYPEQWSLGGS
jgi:peptide/nickel transport system substrate-binding protein